MRLALIIRDAARHNCENSYAVVAKIEEKRESGGRRERERDSEWPNYSGTSGDSVFALWEG